MSLIYVFIAVASLLSAIQTGANATLKKQIGAPITAALLVSVIGTVALALVFAVYQIWSKQPLPNAGQWRSVPWWAWTGGLMSLVYALAIVTVSERVGAGIFLGINVTVAIIASIVMDHFALMGFDRHPAGLGRLAGAALMIGGLLLVAKF